MNQIQTSLMHPPKSDEKPRLSVVTPAYRCAECIPELHRRLTAVLERITSDYEIIFVDDRSPDRDWEVISSLCRKDPHVKGVRLSRNCGQHYALTAGLDHANGTWVVVMDCDLQDKPEAIPALLERAGEGFDIVFARRIDRTDPWTKTLPGDLFGKLLTWLTGVKVDRAIANFSVSSQPAIAAFRQYRERNRSFGMIMNQIGFRKTTVDVPHDTRFAGSSAYTLRSLVRFALQNVLGNTTKPLVLSVQFGAWLAGASILYAIYVLVQYLVLRTVTVPGWASVALLLSFFFGVLFMQLGVIGLYLGSTFEETKRRPLYHVSESLNLRLESEPGH
jgi:dolichol-phosphate mannosyltransferase